MAPLRASVTFHAGRFSEESQRVKRCRLTRFSTKESQRVKRCRLTRFAPPFSFSLFSHPSVKICRRTPFPVSRVDPACRLTYWLARAFIFLLMKTTKRLNPMEPEMIKNRNCVYSKLVVSARACGPKESELLSGARKYPSLVRYPMHSPR